MDVAKDVEIGELDTVVDVIDTEDAKSTAVLHVDPNEDVQYKKEKFMALYQARTVLSKVGTMQERSICKRQLERMKKYGIGSV